MEGYLDNVGLRSVRGWAIDDVGGPARLIVRVNEGSAIEFLPNIYRPDLPFQTEDRLGFETDLGQLLQIGDVVQVTDLGGRHLHGSPLRVTQLFGSKEEKAMSLVGHSAKILEIGPSFNPIAPRSAGWNSFSLDHATQEELIEKYRGAQPVERIEPVDFIWHGGAPEEAVPAIHHGTFDVIIVSHVIEHFPDPIGFYLAAAKLLKDDGMVSLVIPDKRVMFDFFKPISLTSDLLAAHAQNNTRHTKKTAFDNVAYNVFEKGEIAWSWRTMHEFAFPDGVNALKIAKNVFDATEQNERSPYVDYHHTIYTPSSFELIILELGQLGVIPFSIVKTFPTYGCEFYVTLRKELSLEMLSPEVLSVERIRLLTQTLREIADQARWMVNER